MTNTPEKSTQADSGSEDSLDFFFLLFFMLSFKECEEFLKGRRVNRDVQMAMAPPPFVFSKLVSLIILEVKRIH